MVIIKKLVDESKYTIKCPYKMTATRIVIHETANDASAQNEVSYMQNNNLEKSFHFAVDDKDIIQCIPIDRNAWHAGDGNGKGNREGIAVEICYSKSGGERWRKSVENGAKLTAQLLKEQGWGIEKITKHQDYSGKYCPHRILGEFDWKNFILLVEKYMKEVCNVEIQVLKNGSKGNVAKALQILLNGYGFSLVADGVFGSKTETMVKQYQKSVSIGADGIVGEKTWSKLLGN